nr:MAG TPA: hypothetical protein [Caudoviricetes sp.]
MFSSQRANTEEVFKKSINKKAKTKRQQNNY